MLVKRGFSRDGTFECCDSVLLNLQNFRLLFLQFCLFRLTALRHLLDGAHSSGARDSSFKRIKFVWVINFGSKIPNEVFNCFDGLVEPLLVKAREHKCVGFLNETGC